MRAQPGQGFGEAIDIADAADHLLRLEPVRRGLTARVELLEPAWPRQPAARRGRQDRFQMEEEIVMLAVQLNQQAEQPLPLTAQPGLERAPLLGLCQPLLLKACFQARPQPPQRHSGLLAHPPRIWHTIAPLTPRWDGRYQQGRRSALSTPAPTPPSDGRRQQGR